MSTRFQAWLLRNTTSLQYLVNERLAKRSGFIGRIARAIELGPRQYSPHSTLRLFRVANYFWMMSYQQMAMMRGVLSRFAGNSNGPLNYTGLFVYFFCTICITSRFRFIRARDIYYFNA